MDSHFYCEDLNHSISSWNNLNLKFMASCSPEIVPGVHLFLIPKLPKQLANQLQNQWQCFQLTKTTSLRLPMTVMLDCQRVAVRIACAWPHPGGLTTLFHLLPADEEDRARKWKLKWAQRQLNNLKGIENDAAASHSAMGQTAESTPFKEAVGASTGLELSAAGANKWLESWRRTRRITN